VKPAPGETFTVTPHKLPHGDRCGRWHCIVTGPARVTPGAWLVREIKADGDRWQPGMSTCVFESALVTLEVQTDLFGNPVGRAARATASNPGGVS
jgi:hypothetical protein